MENINVRGCKLATARPPASAGKQLQLGISDFLTPGYSYLQSIAFATFTSFVQSKYPLSLIFVVIEDQEFWGESKLRLLSEVELY